MMKVSVCFIFVCWSVAEAMPSGFNDQRIVNAILDAKTGKLCVFVHLCLYVGNERYPVWSAQQRIVSRLSLDSVDFRGGNIYNDVAIFFISIFSVSYVHPLIHTYAQMYQQVNWRSSTIMSLFTFVSTRTSR
jgi:hypothetical protein